MKYVAWLVGVLLAAVVADRLIRTIGEVLESAVHAGTAVAYGPDRQVSVMPEEMVDPDMWSVVDPTDHLLPEMFEENRVVRIAPGESLFPS